MLDTGMRYQVCYEVNRNKNFERTRCRIDPRNFTCIFNCTCILPLYCGNFYDLQIRKIVLFFQQTVWTSIKETSKHGLFHLDQKLINFCMPNVKGDQRKLSSYSQSFI